MEITLSFDNGPDLEETPKVLDILERHNIKATFFLVCDKLRQPEMRAMAVRTKASGHRLGNHTLRHKAPLGINPDPEAILSEVGEAQDLLGDLAEEEKFFRPNGKGRMGPHLLSHAAVDYLTANAFTCVLWSVMPLDGTDPPGWVDRAMRYCEKVDRATVVVHDRAGGGMPYLEDFVRRVFDAGGTFTQDFNPEVVPIVRGRLVAPLDSIANGDPRPDFPLPAYPDL